MMGMMGVMGVMGAMGVMGLGCWWAVGLPSQGIQRSGGGLSREEIPVVWERSAWGEGEGSRWEAPRKNGTNRIHPWVERPRP